MVSLEGKTRVMQHKITLDDLFETIERQNRPLIILDGADYLNEVHASISCVPSLTGYSAHFYSWAFLNSFREA